MVAKLRPGRWALVAAFFVSVAVAQDQVARCEGCHGADGNSHTPGTPSIAGQPKLFLETQLVLYREGVRISPDMQSAVSGLSDREITRIAEQYAARRPRPAGEGPAEAQQVKQALALARERHCGSCHTPDFRGGAQIPRLAGQREEYLVESMLAYRDNRRTGGDTIMAAALYGVSDADIRALAHYLARLR